MELTSSFVDIVEEEVVVRQDDDEDDEFLRFCRPPCVDAVDAAHSLTAVIEKDCILMMERRWINLHSCRDMRENWRQLAIPSSTAMHANVDSLLQILKTSTIVWVTSWL